MTNFIALNPFISKKTKSLLVIKVQVVTFYLQLHKQESWRANGTAVRVEVVPFIEIPLYHIYDLIGSLELHT